MSQINKDSFERAFQLAWFIHPDKEKAYTIARNAMAKLEVTSNAQFKRFYYKPTGRSGKEKTFRNKVMLQESQILQRLLYIESEEIEVHQEQEQPDKVSQNELALRFVKHLVKVTLRRNSFYVTLGVSRLLHNYSTTETMDMFAMVVQDPERVRDDFYYRSRKKRLMKEFRERFGDYLKVVKGYRGEQRFDEQPPTDSLVNFIKTCLERFTPWDTNCVIHQHLDPLGPKESGLAFDGEDPDEEHGVELNRIHTIIHPECYHKLTGSLSLAKPADKLAVPRFSISGEGRPEGGGDRNKPPQVDEEMYGKMLGHLKKQGQDRKRSHSGVLTVKVDGRKVAEIDPVAMPKADFRIDDSSEFIEVFNQDNVLLAAYLISDPENGDQGSEVVLEAGQEFSFQLVLVGNDDSVEMDVTVAYRETQLARKAALGMRQINHKIGQILGVRNPGLVLGPLAAVLIVGFLLVQKDPVDVPDPIKEVETQPVRDNTADGEATRSHGVRNSLALEEIDKVMIGAMNGLSDDARFLSTLREELGRQQRFTISPGDEAQGVLKMVPDLSTDDQLGIALVNESGDLVWSFVIAYEEITQIGVEELARRIVRDLVQDNAN